MALQICIECGAEISDKSSNCIGCGAPTKFRDQKENDIRCIRCGTWLNQDYCPKCGYSSAKSKRARKATGIGLAIFLLFLAIVWVVVFPYLSTETPIPNEPPQASVNQNTEETPHSEPNKEVEESPEDSALITVSEFEAIEIGMSLEEVREIVGSDGETRSERQWTSFDGSVKTYKTVSFDGGFLASASVDFENDKVVSKFQLGLE